MNENSSQDYIELDRKYVKFQDSLSFLKPVNIEIVLKENDAVVILGDKGSGKTIEVKQFQSKHRDNSKYFELKDIYSGLQDVKSKIEVLIKSLDLKNDDSYLYLLFDAIDECRLQGIRKQDAFEITLRKIRNDLENLPIHIISKLKFIFTSREADWKKDADNNLIQKYLSIDTLKQNSGTANSDSVILKDPTNCTTDTGKHDIKISIYTLEELNNEQKRLIAKYLKENEDFFEKDIIAQGYSNTPLDCLEFLKFKTRRRNTAYKMEDFLRYKLQRRYRELNESRNDGQFPMIKIERLSKRLAAATLFCKTVSIQKRESYSDFSTSPRSNDVSLTELFPNEDSSCLNAFTNSALFSANGENSVKFWDELSRDNVAHFWLKDRIEKGKYNEIKNLIFQKCDSIISPKKSFIISAVFLANTEPEFRKYLIEFHPEFLVIYSYCCESLTEFDKKEILSKLLNKYSYRIQNIISVFSNNKKAFSFFVKDFDVEYIVAEFKRMKHNNFLAKIFLMQLLYYSDVKNLDRKLKGKVNSLLFSKKDMTIGINFYTSAVEILLRQEHPKINQKLKAFLLSNISKLSDVTIGTLLEDYLCPEYISFKEVTVLLKKYINEGCDNGGMAYLKIVYPKLIQKLSDASEIKSILDGISFDFSNENEVFIYVSLLIRFIDCGVKSDEISNHLLKLHKYNYDKFYPNSKNEEELEHLKEKITPEINLAFVKKLLEEYKAFKESNHDWFPYDKLYKINDDIMKIFLKETNNKSLSQNSIFYLFNFCLRNLKKTYSDSGTMMQIIKPYLNTKQKRQSWKEFLNPPNIAVKNKISEYKVQKEKNQQFLNEHIEDIRRAAKEYQHIIVGLSLKNKADISSIENEWGVDIAGAYKEGIKKYWQICELDFNQYVNEIVGTKNESLKQTVAGLSGLHLFFQDSPDCLNKLNEEQAKRAIYWGVQKLNLLPDWISKCIKIYPKIAKEIILPIIDKTIELKADNYLLFNLSQIDSDALSVFYEDLWGRIQNQPDSKSICDVVKIITNMNLIDDKKRSDLVVYIMGKISDIENKNTIIWLRLLYNTDKKKFAETIQNLEKKYSNESEKMQRFFISLFNELYLCQFCEVKNKTADNSGLIDLLPLLFKYIDPNNDVQRKNGAVFWTGARDNAESFRDQIFNFISSVNNFRKDDRSRLLDLAKKINHKKYKEYSERIQCVADELLLIDEENLAEDDVIKIEESDYLAPKSADDLFRIVCDKLDEIKTDIETSDYSLKELYQDNIKKEKYFQKYILMGLRKLSRNLYSSVREPEVAANNKPDLQIWDGNWCVNIECKVADNWSGNDMCDTIDSQLIEKYLKYKKYRHGILLLSRIKKDSWEIKKQSVYFSELIKMLQEHADEARKKYIHIKDIRVIGIDYSIQSKNCKK
ncbi:hypothetical protein [Candidatus Endomicrobiellum trichonymphae]|uniref:Uncharacterized protein n=1 Tax=Endomicrobium trichonymphae TaxID=1408204 RepID=B1GZ37_ENDTX|nr:hypothetical protein [Candidatus Endomicrobium trichonymphae]BAG13519.1 conserved hypothetical protein [Candidatus Endomicrobium trichonymphae]